MLIRPTMADKPVPKKEEKPTPVENKTKDISTVQVKPVAFSVSSDDEGAKTDASATLKSSEENTENADKGTQNQKTARRPCCGGGN
ncbi:hypothetical protein C0J52_22686 [Blattella germanica]|nr:hypothetical protein C0J52_22686 [Blattella germanica]